MKEEIRIVGIIRNISSYLPQLDGVDASDTIDTAPDMVYAFPRIQAQQRFLYPVRLFRDVHLFGNLE